MIKSNKLPQKKTKRITAFNSNNPAAAMPTETTTVTLSTVTTTHFAAN